MPTIFFDLQASNKNMSTIFDYTDNKKPVPSELLSRITPVEVVIFSIRGLRCSLLERNFNTLGSHMYFSKDPSNYPNLQLYCLMCIADKGAIIKACYATNTTGERYNIFEVPRPEIVEIWDILKENNLYATRLHQVMIDLGLGDPELYSAISAFDAKFTNQIKSARNI